MRFLLACISALLLAGPSVASNCTKTGQRCLDAAPTKTFSGLAVSVDQVGGCWEYEDTYTCIKPASINHCAAIEATPGCSQTSTTPSVVAFNGTTMVERKTFRCGDPTLTAPTNTIQLPNSYTITKDELDNSQCEAYSSNPMCQQTSQTCVEGAATRVIEGLPVYKDCWKYDTHYACVSKQMLSDCKPLIDNGCTLSATSCMSRLADGSCSVTTKSYSCEKTPPSTITSQDCGTQTYCDANGNCTPAGNPPDTDMAKTAALLEIMREGGNYMDPNSLTLFGGVGEGCTKGYMGLKNCCKTTGNAQSNQALMGSITAQGVTQVGGTAATFATYKATPYVYDYMYKAGFADKAVGGMMDFVSKYGGAVCANCSSEWLSAGGTGVGVVGNMEFAGSSLSMYGVSIGYGALTELSATAIGGAATSAASSLGLAGATASEIGTSVTSMLDTYNFATDTIPLGNGFSMSFNPYAMAASIAIQVIMDALSCNQDEAMLGMHRGANLCHYVGTYCSNELNLLVGKICLETTDSFCCYNSRLARIINEQGRPQIGKGWGSGESPSCGGFTQSDFQNLDFAKMDLSEFINEIMATVTLPDTSAIAGNAKIRVNNAVQSYYDRP